MSENEQEFPIPMAPRPDEGQEEETEHAGEGVAPYLKQSISGQADASALAGEAVFVQTISAPQPVAQDPELDSEEGADAVEAINDPANADYFAKLREEREK